MGKLTNLKPKLAALTPRIAFSQDPAKSDQRIIATPTWKRWYHTKGWARLRLAVFVRDLFACQMCGRIEGDTSKLVADHKKPHRGNPRLFWDMANLQTLCADPCHNTKKQQEEAASPPGMWD